MPYFAANLFAGCLGFVRCFVRASESCFVVLQLSFGFRVNSVVLLSLLVYAQNRGLSLFIEFDSLITKFSAESE